MLNNTDKSNLIVYTAAVAVCKRMLLELFDKLVAAAVLKLFCFLEYIQITIL